MKFLSILAIGFIGTINVQTLDDKTAFIKEHS